MKIVRLLGKSLVEFAEVPEPEASGDFVVVKIMASSICGTERHAYEEGLTPAHSGAGVVNLGHEAAGVVWKTSATSRLKVGDRVNLFASITHCGRCRYCVTGRWILCQGEPRILGAGFHAEYVKIREDFCLPLADDIPFEIGALFGDVLGTALHAIRRLRLSALDTVLVMGQGPIGLASSLICQFFGAKVIAADTNPKRLELAKACGAKETFLVGEQNMAASLAELAGVSGIDVAIDCAGAQASRLACLEAVRPGGRVAFIGLGQGFSLDQNQYRENFLRKDLELISSWYSDPADMFELEKMVRRGFDPAHLITHDLPLDQASEGFRLMFSGHGGKVILRPNSVET